MLTQDDLAAIDILVEKRFSTLSSDVKGLKEDIGGLENEVTKTTKEVVRMGKSIRKLTKKQDEMFNFLDEENVRTKKRLKAVEDTLNISPKP